MIYFLLKILLHINNIFNRNFVCMTFFSVKLLIIFYEFYWRVLSFLTGAIAHGPTFETNHPVITDFKP